MGTRADFYVGRGESAEWLGSIGWDGYPDGISKALLACNSEDEFRAALAEFFSSRRDVTLPAQGWPWPWDTSHTTDYAYAFDAGEVWASCFGGAWANAASYESMTDKQRDALQGGAVFPNMAERKNVAFGHRSGLIVISA